MTLDWHWTQERSRLYAAKQRLWTRYRRDPSVLGMAIGQRVSRGQPTGEPAVVVYVCRKLPWPDVPPALALPRQLPLDGSLVEVDVVETGPIRPLAFVARERPVLAGVSIGHVAGTAGTLGSLVVDQTDGSACILSNNHVLAADNGAAAGDPIVQPGPRDGGRSPVDDVARLKRFVPLAADGNVVDAAIAQVIDPTDVENRMTNDAMPMPGPDHPAIGLLFCGSRGRSFINPIDQVIALLSVRFLGGPGAVIPADIGMEIEKTGRTTEYTASTVLEIGATIKVTYAFGDATFDDQIAAAVMAEPGDSGSIVCRRSGGP